VSTTRDKSARPGAAADNSEGSASNAAPTSSSVPGQPPPACPVRRYSGVTVTKPTSVSASAIGLVWIRSKGARQNPPCRITTVSAGPAAAASGAAGNRTSMTCSASSP
jgi:hypothetical protein